MKTLIAVLAVICLLLFALAYLAGNDRKGDTAGNAMACGLFSLVGCIIGAFDVFLFVIDVFLRL